MKKRYTFTLDDDLVDPIRKRCEIQGVALSAYINTVLRETQVGFDLIGDAKNLGDLKFSNIVKLFQHAVEGFEDVKKSSSLNVHKDRLGRAHELAQKSLLEEGKKK